MRNSRTLLIPVLFLCTVAVPQVGKEQSREPAGPPHATTLTPASIARLGFQSNLPFAPGDSRFTQVCIALRRDGHYWLVRRRATGMSEKLTGSLKPEDQTVLTDLLSKARQEESTGGRLLRHDAELLRVELPGNDGIVHRTWISASDEGIVFPKSIENVVNWLQHFEAADAKPVDQVPNEICPSGEVKPLQPSSASR